MSTHPRRRLAVALTIAGTLAGGALAGPAMAAAGDPGPGGGRQDDLTVRQAGGGDQQENLTVRKAGGRDPEFVTLRQAGGDPIGYIIAI
jgi:hypothetical protein